MIDEKLLEKLSKHKEPEVRELVESYIFYAESPFEDSYTATYKTIQSFNVKLKESKIDILNIEDKPKFEMAHKYLTELDGYLNTLEKIRARMSPEYAKRIDEKLKEDKMGNKDKSLAL